MTCVLLKSVFQISTCKFKINKWINFRNLGQEKYAKMITGNEREIYLIIEYEADRKKKYPLLVRART